MNKRQFLKGIAATAAGIIVPGHVLSGQFEFHQRISGLLSGGAKNNPGAFEPFNSISYEDFSVIRDAHGLEVAHPSMTAATVDGFSVSATSVWSGSYPAHYSFRYTATSGGWLGGRAVPGSLSEYIQMTFPEPKEIKAFGIFNSLGGTVGGGAKDITVFLRDEDGNWLSVGDFVAPGFSSISEGPAFNLTGSHWRYYGGDWLNGEKVTGIRFLVNSLNLAGTNRKANPRLCVFEKG